MSQLVFVRHGQTDANRNGVLLGRLDPPLNDAGREQAAAVGGARSRCSQPARIVTSPLCRTVETAEIVAEACAIGEVEVDDAAHRGRLRRVRRPAARRAARRTWCGSGATTPTSRRPAARAWRRSGSGWASSRARCSTRSRDGPVVAVSHVSPIKAAVLWALGLPDLYAWRLRLDNASITRLAPGPDGPVLLSFNER